MICIKIEGHNALFIAINDMLNVPFILLTKLTQSPLITKPRYETGTGDIKTLRDYTLQQ